MNRYHLGRAAPSIRAVASIFVCGIATLAGCESSRTPDDAADESRQLPVPIFYERPIQAMLPSFGDMLCAFVPQDEPILIEVDLVPNDTGIDKELPRDLSPYVTSAIADIGGPLRSVTKPYAAATVIPTASAGNAVLIEGGVNDPRRPAAPVPTMRVGGRLLRASETVIGDQNVRGDALIKKSQSNADIQTAADHKQTIAPVRVTLSLTQPDGVSLPGPSSTCDVRVHRREKGFTFGFYIDGNGAGFEQRLQVIEDTGDAMADAIAASLVKNLSHVYFLPYTRLNPMFPPDPRLEAAFRDKLQRSTRATLEGKLKQLLFVDGVALNMQSAALTDADRAAARKRLAPLGYNIDDNDQIIEGIVHLWNTIDYHAAAKRVRNRLAQSVREKSELLAKEQAEIAPHRTDPAPNAAPASPPSEVPAVTRAPPSSTAAEMAPSPVPTAPILPAAVVSPGIANAELQPTVSPESMPVKVPITETATASPRTEPMPATSTSQPSPLAPATENLIPTGTALDNVALIDVLAKRFNWPRDAFILVIDVNRLKEADDRRAVGLAIGSVTGCDDLRFDESGGFYAARFAGRPQSVQSAIRRQFADRVQCVWTDSDWSRLVVTPRQ